MLWTQFHFLLTNTSISYTWYLLLFSGFSLGNTCNATKTVCRHCYLVNAPACGYAFLPNITREDCYNIVDGVNNSMSRFYFPSLDCVYIFCLYDSIAYINSDFEVTLMTCASGTINMSKYNLCLLKFVVKYYFYSVTFSLWKWISLHLILSN